jgi:hypothetical protein
MVLSNGGLTVNAGPASVWQSIRTTISNTSGKRYIEFLITNVGSTTRAYPYVEIGLANNTFIPTAEVGTSNYSGAFGLDGTNIVSAGFTSNYVQGGGAVNNDVWAMAVDFSAGRVWFAQNNVWLNSSNPATSSLPMLNFIPATVGSLFAAVSLTPTVGSWTLQAAAASQRYAPPSGFSAWDAP